jgi:hypothetical protein
MTKRAQPLVLKQPESSATRTEPQRTADLQRHARKCAICNHADRESIEFEFIYWEDPVDLTEEYNLPSRSCVYRHVEAPDYSLSASAIFATSPDEFSNKEMPPTSPSTTSSAPCAPIPTSRKTASGTSLPKSPSSSTAMFSRTPPTRLNLRWPRRSSR